MDAVATETDKALARAAPIGRYLVLDLVGRGAMGEVYAAYDPELDRKVAIKLLRVRGRLGNATEGRRRLMREAQAIAKLSHPNVVTVYDVGTFQDQVFIAMQFVDGCTLGYWIHAETRTWPEILKIFADAGRGLTAAHEKDLIHRDFKPDNVMIGTDGGVRVMDFGLARVVIGRGRTVNAPARPSTPSLAPAAGANANAKANPRPLRAGSAPDPEHDLDQDLDSTRQLGSESGSGAALPPHGAGVNHPPSVANSAFRTTPGDPIESLSQEGAGALVGTPAYMSPEQFRGEETGAYSDQFSFCVALYEALYGERPFAGTTLASFSESVLAGQVRDAPRGVDIPPWVRKILLRGLRVRPEERWPSMKALLAELEKNRAVARRRRFVSGAAAKLAGVWEAPIRGRPVETPAKADMRRAFLATGKRYARDAFETASAILDRYAAGWAEMYIDACLATHVRGEQSEEVLDLRMASLQEGLDGLKALSRVFRNADGDVVENAVSAAKALGAVAHTADIEFLRAVVKPPEDAQIRATVNGLRARLADVRVSCRVGRLTAGLEAIAPLEQEARLTGYEPLLAETLFELGNLHLERRDSIAASLALEEAVWTAERCRHDEIAAKAAAQLVYSVGENQLRFDAGEIWFRHAETVLRRMGGHDQLWGWLYNNRGTMRERQGRLAEALEDTRAAVAAKERAGGPDDPDVAQSLGNMALFLAQLGEAAQALPLAERAVKISEAGFGPDHPRSGIHLSNLGEILNAFGRFAEARMYAQRALAIFESETDPEGVIASYALTALAFAYLGEGMADRALPIFERVVAIREAKECESSRVGEVQFGLARALRLTAQGGDSDGARARDLAVRGRAEYARATPTPAVDRAICTIDAWLAS